jgi:hypothetical protein
MSPRLTSRMTVDALFRRAATEGGFGSVLAHGDDGAGGILLLCRERGRVRSLLERGSDLDGNTQWLRCGPQDAESDSELDAYIQRRRDRDRDLWLIELDIPDAERFIAES